MAGAEEKTLVEILEELNKIDIVKYINYVTAPQCGAVATFSGTTRDIFEGKTVVELRYEAYVPMAVRCLKSICARARSIWNLHAISVAHRLGSVPVQETSVFVAISSVHRADALDACKFIIDELKASVPIWKKEVYSNGEVWKENSEFLERMSNLGKDDHPSNGVAKLKSHGGKSCCGTKVKVVEGALEENGNNHSIQKTEDKRKSSTAKVLKSQVRGIQKHKTRVTDENLPGKLIDCKRREL